MNRELLIVFTRYPEPGKTKTRLIPLLGAEGAAILHRQMAEHTLAQVRELRRENPLSVEVHFTGGNQQFMQNWLGSNFILRSQQEGDLGCRMASAFQTAFSNGQSRVAIIGTDCPALSANILAQAFAVLSQHDLVLGPAQDGGYYLIGLRQFIPELFAGINWGTSEVLQKTADIAQKLDLKVTYLPLLADVDRPSDLPNALDCWQFNQ